VTPNGPHCDHRWAHVPGGFPVCRVCGRVPSASPSQAETRKTCPRKHAFSRVRERTQTAAAAYGDRCHALAEAWGKTGAVPDNRTPEGRTVVSTLPHLPPPRTAAVEITVEPVFYGIPWIMRLDFVERAPDFGDLKTTGDFVHVKTPEVLASTDPQSISYSHALCTMGRQPFVRGRWVYGKRLGKTESAPPARVVRFEMSAAHAKAAFDEMHETVVAPMVRDRVKNPLDVVRIVSKASCGAFGGCPYRRECLSVADEQALAVEALISGGRRGSSLTDAGPIVYTSDVSTPDLIQELRANAGAPADPRAAAIAYVMALPEADRMAAMQALGLAPTAASVLPPTPVVAPQAAPVSAPVPAPVDVFAAALAASTQAPVVVLPSPAEAFGTTTAASTEVPKRGRPPKTSVAVTADKRADLIIACASGGQSPQDAAAYLSLLEGAP
jgi:hypothetical protein